MSLQMQLRRFWSSELPAPEQARAMLVALSVAAGCYMLAGLIDVSTSVVRFSRGGAPLSSSEIVLATLGSIGLLTAPILAWARFVIDQVWPSTPRTLDVLGRGKRVLATSLVTYAMGMLLVRLFDGAFHSDTSGVAWPGWGLIIFLGAALTGGVSAWRASRFREFAE
jgi:hypothetical protein